MKWDKLLKKAFEHKHKSEMYLRLSAQELAKDCGFSEEESSLFGANFAGNEAVVTYNECGEMADLDLRFMCGMSKEDILKRLNIK